MSKILYTETSGKELLEEGVSFYAEDKNIYEGVDVGVFKLEVENAVKLQIQYEKDGVTVYKVKPEQVFNIKQVK